MLRRLTLKNFKCFKSFILNTQNENVLIGPNNAGKSTIVEALRVGSAIMATAARRNPTHSRDVGDDTVQVFPIRDFRVPIELENLRHEFHAENPTSVRLEFDNDLRVTARWDAGDDPDAGYFYVEVGDGGQPASVRLARAIIDRASMGVLPHLRPIDMRETVKKPDYVQRHQGGRLSSAHFRNQLALLRHERLFERYCEFVRAWLPEVKLESVDVDYAADSINVYFSERGREREVCWAGDGVQVFLQVLLHLFRAEGTATVVLDEPEVFLHADLQQRLLGVLDEHGGQVIIATHSSEIVAAVPSESLAWVDKSRPGAIRLTEGSDQASLVDSLGSVFNLKMARVLKTRRAVFVEGQELKVLARLGATLGFARLEGRPDVAVVPLDGGSNWRKLEAFDWIAGQFLKGALSGYAVFDRDFHTDAALAELVDRLGQVNVEVHVWTRHEIENYLLVPDAIARLSGASAERVAEIVGESAAGLRDRAIASTAGALAEEGRTRGLDLSTVYANARSLVDEWWGDPGDRERRLPGKELLSMTNAILQGEGFKAVNTLRLARELHVEEIDPELARVIRRAADTETS